MIDEQLADRIVAFLNELNAIDTTAIEKFIEHRVPCNAALSMHPTVQCGLEHNVMTVGLLGILNGLVGAREDQWGVVAMEVEDDGRITRFVKLPTNGKGGRA